MVPNLDPQSCKARSSGQSEGLAIALNLAQRQGDTEDGQMEMNDISGLIVDRAVHIHRTLGPGLLESVYQRILAYELRKVGLTVETEVPIPVSWDGHVIDDNFRADIIVNGMYWWN